MVFLWDFLNISMGILCNFYGVSMILYSVSKGVFMVVLWDSYKDVYGISFGFLSGFCGISMIFLWDFFGISMISLVGFL